MTSPAPLTGRYVAVVGPAEPPEHLAARATEVGRLLAEAGAVVLTGGMGGVMRAAAAGAREAGGLAVGLLPGLDRSDGAPEHGVLLPTGLGELRNGLLVRAADAVVAVGCSWGTLSEIALARRTGVPLVLLEPWELPTDVGTVVDSPGAAVSTVERDLSG